MKAERPRVKTPPPAPEPTLYLYWSGALERRGDAPGLSSPHAGSTLGPAVTCGVGVDPTLRRGAPKRGRA